MVTSNSALLPNRGGATSGGERLRRPPLTAGQEIYANDFNDIRGGVR